MTTIILVAIGVLIAAAAALIMFFYGGTAFNAADVKAEAATIINHLSMIQSAVSLYNVENDAPAQPGSLAFMTPYYMHMIPLNPEGPAFVYEARMMDGSQPSSSSNGLDLVEAQIPKNEKGTAVCSQIAFPNGLVAQYGSPPVVTSAATVPKTALGCFEAEGWGGLSGVYVTYARNR